MAVLAQLISVASVLLRDFLSLYFAHLNLKRCRTRFEDAD
jgi:hypothetical protein